MFELDLFIESFSTLSVLGLEQVVGERLLLVMFITLKLAQIVSAYYYFIYIFL